VCNNGCGIFNTCSINLLRLCTFLDTIFPDGRTTNCIPFALAATFLAAASAALLAAASAALLAAAAAALLAAAAAALLAAAAAALLTVTARLAFGAFVCVDISTARLTFGAFVCVDISAARLTVGFKSFFPPLIFVIVYLFERADTMLGGVKFFKFVFEAKFLAIKLRLPT
jgi:hypothetical protein